ncbi:MAG: tRNA pseudouridine(55) synthase TruB [Clostridiales bacterium]|nr:tRNA pseudouridine(55) synthase TruB [Clostridiales bacterium]
MNGIINVYKEKGFTSFDVCAKLRGILKTRKIGHTGTLDPDAEGVLPVCVGNATNLCELLTDKDKVYETVLYLGVTTDTEDMTGTVLTTSEVRSTKEEVEAAIHKFIGQYNQIPPMYSAIKVNGQRLYDLARKGEVIERKSRSVIIHSVEVLEYIMDETNPNYVRAVRMSVSCSKGTYIRTLCKDIGETLGCGGCMKSLLRTRVSVFDLSNSLRLDQIEELVQQEKVDQVLIPVDKMFPNLVKAQVTKAAERFLMNGNPLRKHQLQFSATVSYDTNFEILVYDSKNTFTGIFEYKVAEQCFKPVKMFLQ